MSAALVEYYPDWQILLIETGQKSVAGEEFASDIIVRYDKDRPDERCSAVAIRIDSAERVLEPFVDAILKKHGVEPEEEAAKTRVQD